MIRIIKSNDKQNRHEYLEKSIGAYYDINHQIEGDMNLLRNSPFTRRNHKEEQVNEVMEKIKGNLNDMLNNVKKNIRKAMDD
jgi:DNA-directed RNA polymerase subunit L